MAPPRKEWIPYEEVKLWVHKLKLGNYKDWLQYVQEHKIPKGIPRNPQITYGKDYISDADFLGHVDYWTYEEAKLFAQSLNLTKYHDWLKWHKKHKPKNIPRYPDQVYESWESWGEFLGTGTIDNYDRQFRKYAEAIKFVHNLGLKSRVEWLAWCKTDERPIDIPTNPERVYAKWNGWSEWLGNNVVDRVRIQATLDPSILYIIQEQDMPPNVFTIDVEPNGKSALVDRQKIEGFAIGKTFPYDKTKKKQIDEIIARYAVSYYGSSNAFTVGFIRQLVYDLQQLLES